MCADVENANCITASINIIAANFFKINCWFLALKVYPKDETEKNNDVKISSSSRSEKCTPKCSLKEHRSLEVQNVYSQKQWWCNREETLAIPREFQGRTKDLMPVFVF